MKIGALDGISLRSKIALVVAALIMLIFFGVQSCMVFGLCGVSYNLAIFGYLCVILFMPPFAMVVTEFIQNKAKVSLKLASKITEFEEFEKFVQKSVLVSKADRFGKITYVNSKFEEVSGWKLDEVVGKDHVIVNSNLQEPGYWGKMYQEVHSGKIWNDVVTNRAKNGELYYVDTYIRAEFDYHGKVIGYTSIRQDVSDIIRSTKELAKKNTYLEHAAKIIRHDMHSGINTYLPRGIKSLQRRLTEEDIDRLKIKAPMQLIMDGLFHAQKVYAGVYEFTNLVKENAGMSKEECSIKEILIDYLRLTAYKNQVILDDALPTIEVNESLFCTAVDNLIRNGLRYNDSGTKWVKIYPEENFICIEDNGRGLTNEEFVKLSEPYARNQEQRESGSGLGLNICIQILKEHNFSISAENTGGGTKLKIKIK